MVRVSVAMCTYNGAAYLEEQITTIMTNLAEKDELIISDDGSTDGTRKLLAAWQEKDRRIHVIEGPHMGVKKNVECAISHTNGSYIFLADQDDIWASDKVERVLEQLSEPDCHLVIHDTQVVGEDGHTVVIPSFFSYKNSGAGAWKNIWVNTYIGCCMAFDETLKQAVLPIPNDIEMHDQWIGVINDLRDGHTCFLPKPLIRYRRHGDNTSSMKHYGVIKMIKKRVILIWELIRWSRT